jgi:hypothetical protein
MITRALHTIEAHYWEICDIMRDGEWSDFFYHRLCFGLNLFKEVPFPAFMKNDV